MALSRRNRIWLVLSICVAAAAVMATLAIAGEKQAVISATGFHVPQFWQKSEYATCPGSKRVLGGGAVQSGAATQDMPFYLTGSGPLDASGSSRNTIDGDTAKRWYAAVYDGGDSSEFKVFAICARAPGATIEATKFFIDHNEIGKKSVTCPPNKRALGGGILPVRLDEDDEAEDYDTSTSGPVDASGKPAKTRSGDVAKRWQASAMNFTGNNHMAFKVFAICAPNSNATIETTRFTVETGPGGNGVQDALVECPGSKRAVGGGVTSLDPSFGMYVMANGPLNSSGDAANTVDGDRAKNWYVAMFSQGGVAKDVKISAICV